MSEQHKLEKGKVRFNMGQYYGICSCGFATARCDTRESAEQLFADHVQNHTQGTKQPAAVES